MTYPLVLPDDSGLRDCKPGQCFYCGSKIGTPHGTECVAVTNIVKVRYTYEIEIEVPAHWSSHDIEFHRNDGSWCADSGIHDLEDYRDKLNAEGSCLCHCFKCDFLGDVDPTPRSKSYKPATE